MLPDWPQVKGDLAKKLEIFVRERVQVHLGPLGQIRQASVFEGESQQLVRAKGDIEHVPFEETYVDTQATPEELIGMPFDKLLERFDQMAQEMAGKIATSMYASLSEAVERVGNTIDARGTKLTAEMLLTSLGKIQIDFGPDGLPKLPAIHIHPKLVETVELATAKLESDPALRQEFQALIDSKREEWNVREASRELVG